VTEHVTSLEMFGFSTSNLGSIAFSTPSSPLAMASWRRRGCSRASRKSRSWRPSFGRSTWV